MNLRSVVDSSFLYNAFQLEILRYLCLLFDRIILVPSVLSECVRFQSQLLQLKCVEKVILTDIEKREVNKLQKGLSKECPNDLSCGMNFDSNNNDKFLRRDYDALSLYYN